MFIHPYYYYFVEVKAVCNGVQSQSHIVTSRVNDDQLASRKSHSHGTLLPWHHSIRVTNFANAGDVEDSLESHGPPSLRPLRLAATGGRVSTVQHFQSAK